jgi:predicted RecB family nuclease
MATDNMITAAMLYDLVQCPHRPTMDLFGDPADRDEVNPFIQLLWEKGTAFEAEVVAGLDLPILDLSGKPGVQRERLTNEAMEQKIPLIYAGRISADDLLGDPDLLRLDGDKYVAGDIKSGGGEEGSEDSARLKKHYGVQLALYTDILERKERSASRRPFVWDAHGEEVIYDLDEPQGIRNPWTVWELYERTLKEARCIIEQSHQTRAAYGAACKLCHWHSACLKDLDQAKDLTLLPELGRAKRDVLIEEFATIEHLAGANVEAYVQGKKTVFPGIGPDTLRKFRARAELVTSESGKPYLTKPVSFPTADIELFFDIEVDPMRDHCYLHGFVERRNGVATSERYFAFLTEDTSSAEEERAFREAWYFIQERQPCTIYYYSKYERTIWRKLQEKYPPTCSAEEIEKLFDPTTSIDLYFDVVKKATEWPTRDHSIKTLAKYLGFNWRDSHPSGAASIEWFDRWITTGDDEIKQRILNYNEDDCIATRVLLDGIKML